jgi:hypothetical protein
VHAGGCGRESENGPVSRRTLRFLPLLEYYNPGDTEEINADTRR